MMGVGCIGEIAPLDRPALAIFSLRVAARQGRLCGTRSLCWLLCKEWAYSNLTLQGLTSFKKILADKPLWCVRGDLGPAPCNPG